MLGATQILIAHWPRKADAKAVISRQEVHERFQLFHRALENVENASRDGLGLRVSESLKKVSQTV